MRKASFCNVFFLLEYLAVSEVVCMANDYDFVDDHVNLYVSDQNQRVIV